MLLNEVNRRLICLAGNSKILEAVINLNFFFGTSYLI